MSDTSEPATTGQDDAPELNGTSVEQRRGSKALHRRPQSRSASPSKRPASEMEEDEIASSVEHMEVDGASAAKKPAHQHNPEKPAASLAVFVEY